VNGHIFISYKSEERAYADAVRAQIEAWGYETWMDVYRLEAGTHWANEIDRALKSAAVVVGMMTPAALGSRYVTNEWDMAIRLDTPFVPLLHEKCEPHYKYIDIHYIDFTGADKQPAFDKLKSRLQSPRAELGREDPYRDYLNVLFDRINKFLAEKIVHALDEPIKLETEVTHDVVLFEKQPEIDPLYAIGGLTADEPETELRDFGAAFEHYDGRVLLLGEPGAGKTITLLHFGRDAVVRRINDPTQPLPILGIIPTWDAYKQPTIPDWLAASYGAPPDAVRIVREGKMLLLLDGLDELGGERPGNPDKPEGEKFDPRLRFMRQIEALISTPPPGPLPEFREGEKSRKFFPQILVTCRPKDYEQIGAKIALRGAVKLKPLKPEQQQIYLAGQDTLREAIKADERLREMLSTPLLLSFFAFAYEGMTAEERPALAILKEAGDVRDAIFRKYVEERYAHEVRKPYARMEFDVSEIYEVCGALAWKRTTDFLSNKSDMKPGYFRAILPEEHVPLFIEQAVRLHILAMGDGDRFRFVHLLLHDHFAFAYALAHLQSDKPVLRSDGARMLGALSDARAVEPLILALNDVRGIVRMDVASALGSLRDARAVQPLIVALKDIEAHVRDTVAEVLGRLGDARAVEPLIAALKDEKASVRDKAASALGRLDDTRAVEPLIDALKDEHAPVRTSVVGSLERLGDIRAVESLIDVLKDEKATVRIATAQALGRLGDARAVTPLIAALKDRNASVRRIAAWALGNLTDTSVVQLTFDALSDVDKWMHTRVADLRQISAPAIAPLSETLYDSDKAVSVSAYHALERIGTPEALAAVEQWRREQGGQQA
jgi:HEAT repeat protein